MLDEVKKLAGEEACGLVAGIDQTSQAVYPVPNILHSLVRYRMDPERQLAVFNQIDENGWQLLAIYHSHPSGPAEPSALDRELAHYPDLAYLVVSLGTRGVLELRAFRLAAGSCEELELALDGAPA